MGLHLGAQGAALPQCSERTRPRRLRPLRLSTLQLLSDRVQPPALRRGRGACPPGRGEASPSLGAARRAASLQPRGRGGCVGGLSPLPVRPLTQQRCQLSSPLRATGLELVPQLLAVRGKRLLLRLRERARGGGGGRGAEKGSGGHGAKAQRSRPGHYRGNDGPTDRALRKHFPQPLLREPLLVLQLLQRAQDHVAARALRRARRGAALAGRGGGVKGAVGKAQSLSSAPACCLARRARGVGQGSACGRRARSLLARLLRG